MNDPRTCVYGHARKFGACGERGTCTRPRSLPCLCGLVKARVPEPGPDKLAPQGAASPWTHNYAGTPMLGFNCQGTVTGRLPRHEPPFHELPGSSALKRVAQMSLGLEKLDYRAIEERVVAHCCESAEFTEAAWNALGRCPWDNWKPGRDVA